jgi:hypothetical protein
MFGSTDAADDSAFLNMRLSGLKPVPEPATVLLVLSGIGIAAVKRWS